MNKTPFNRLPLLSDRSHLFGCSDESFSIMVFFRPIKRRPKIYNTKYCSQAANVHATCALIDSTKRTDKFKRLSAVINDESEENDKELVIATNKINYKL